MRKIIFKYVIFVFALSTLSSCSDEYLEEINPNEIAKNNFWRNLDETNLGLNATYKTLYNPAILNIIPETLRSDMGYPGYGRPVPQNTDEYYNQTYNGSSPEIAEKWTANYLGIFRANQVIQSLNNLKVDSEELEEWTSQMAQARFLRGLFHYYLYSTFNNGSIIIRDFVPVTPDEFSKPLSSAEEVITFIKDDLEYAYEHLYKNKEYPDNDLSRATSGAAATVLGTIYLNELNYTEAMTYFDDVINNHNYALETDLSKMFTTAGEFNSESIFEINFTADFIEIENSRWDGSSGTNWLNQQTSGTKGATGAAWITYEYKSEPMDPLDTRNYFNHPTEGKSFRPVPLRAASMMAVVDDNATTFYLNGTTSEYTRFHGKGWGFGWWKKYTNHDIVASETELPNNSATLSSKNVTVNRLSEVFLMQAECEIKTGDIDGAIELINQIRQRWGLVLLGSAGADNSHTYDDIDYTAETLMLHLMNIEKPLEMGAEGHCIRFLDFQRWKKSEGYGFEDRLQDLSERTYYGVNFTYVNSLGRSVTRQNYPSIVRTDPGGNNFVVDFEFDMAHSNYNEEENGTYPIPFVEIITNPNINN